MILKKPYAFLIKHFRLIHLIIALATIFLTYKTSKIVLFFNAYIKNGYRLTESNLASNYVTILMYLAVLLILLVAIVIYLLFKEKDKPRKYYVYLIVYYILLFSLLAFAHNALNSLEITTVSAKTVRMYRDLSLIFSLPQYFFLVFTLIRGIGFDIKKFNFSKDISELQIEAKDNEEFEFVVDLPTYKIKRTIRRSLRELKYFALENTFVLICVLIIIALVIGTTIYTNRNTYSQTYEENQTFTLNNYKVRVLDTIISPLDYNGHVLTKGKSYLIVLLSMENKTNTSKVLNKDDYRLLIDDKIVYPTTNKNEYFIDLGNPYANQKIAKKSTSNYAFIYEITNEEIRSEYTLRIQEYLDYRNNEIIANYKEIKIKPAVIKTLETVKSVNLNEKLDLSASTLSKSDLLVSNYEITKSYKYNYTFCIDSDCQTSIDTVDATYQTEKAKTLLVLSYTLNLDATTPYKNNIKSNLAFFNDFLKVKYTYDNKEYTSAVVNKTPNNITDKVVLELPAEIKNAANISLIFTIRDKVYSIVLK